MKQSLVLLSLVLFGALVLAPATSVAAAGWGPLSILDAKVKPGEKAQLSFLTEPSFSKETLDIPVLVARGRRPGPTFCITAAVHGDELNGVEIARSVFESVDAEQLAGTLIALPIVNVWGFRSDSRYMTDRRDLNREFPGSPTGSLAGRIAYAVFNRVIVHCNALVDLHTGSDERTNLPQIRADLDKPDVVELATRFDVGIVIAGEGPAGSLRRAANDAGIATILYEAGGPGRFESEEIQRGIEGVTNLMEYLGLVANPPPTPDPQRLFRNTQWLRSNGGGIFMSELVPGARVHKGDLLGIVTDPITNQEFRIEAPIDGTLVGMAYPQVVLPGFALFHIAGHDQGAVEPATDE